MPPTKMGTQSPTGQGMAWVPKHHFPLKRVLRFLREVGYNCLQVIHGTIENISIDPSQITACAAKVVIVMDEVKLLNSNINVTKITLHVKVTSCNDNFVMKP